VYVRGIRVERDSGADANFEGLLSGAKGEALYDLMFVIDEDPAEKLVV
jgi:hypothetical protein